MKHKCRPYKAGQQFKYAHLKRDGIWLEVHRNATSVRAYTSHPTEISNQLDHCQWFANIVTRVPVGQRLYGELWVPGQRASYVKSALAKGESMSFDCFAVPTLPEDTPLERLREHCILWGIPFAPYLIRDRERTWDEVRIFDSWVSEHGRDVEGAVFKNGNLLDWHKWKPVRTIDAIVTGILDGRGKNTGLIGSLQVSLANGQVIANVGGMTDEERILMSDDEDALIGKVIEVAYQYVGSGKKLRHPRFVRFRDDKQPHECTQDQDDDL